MKKIKIDKIKIADMSLDRKMDVNGGVADDKQHGAQSMRHNNNCFIGKQQL